MRDGRLLVTRHRTPGDTRPDWHILPGGGQLPGETVTEAVVREVLEETGLEVAPDRLLWVRELIIALRDEHPFDPADHAIEMMFDSQVVAERGEPVRPDEDQIAVEWLDPGQLRVARFYPKSLLSRLASFIAGGDPGPVYLGDVD